MTVPVAANQVSTPELTSSRRSLRNLRSSSSSPSRIRRGLSALVDRLRPSRRANRDMAQSLTEGSAESPANLLARFLESKAAGVFASIDDEGLLNYRGTWMMQLNALEEMNAKTALAIDSLFTEATSLEAKQAEAETLLAEIDQRKRNITVLKLSIKLVEVELQKRGVSLSRPVAETGIIDVPEDANICQYCISNEANTEYTCCRHQGACWDCATVMMKNNSRCPHCRAENAVVRNL